MIAAHDRVLSDSRNEDYEKRNESSNENMPPEENLLVTDYAYPIHPLHHVPSLLPRGILPPSAPIVNPSVAGSEVELARRLGVRFDSSNAAWVARWIEPHSEKKKSRWFSVAKYGELSARRLAIQACLYNMKPSDCPSLRDLQDVLSNFSAAPNPAAPPLMPDGATWPGFVPPHHVLVPPPGAQIPPNASVPSDPTSGSVPPANSYNTNNPYMASPNNSAILGMASLPQLGSICQGIPQHQAVPGYVISSPGGLSPAEVGGSSESTDTLHNIHSLHNPSNLDSENTASPTAVNMLKNLDSTINNAVKINDSSNEIKTESVQPNIYTDWNTAYNMSQQQTPPPDYSGLKLKTPSTADSYYVETTTPNYDLSNHNFIQPPPLETSLENNNDQSQSQYLQPPHLEDPNKTNNNSNLYEINQDNGEEVDEEEEDDETYDETYRPPTKTDDDDFYSEDGEKIAKKRKIDPIDLSSENMMLNGGVVSNGVMPPHFPGLYNSLALPSPYYQLYQPFGPQQGAPDGFAFLNPYQMPLMPHHLHPHHAAFFSQLQPIDLSSGSSGTSGGVTHGMSAKMTCERGLHYSRCYHGNKECWIAVWNTKGGRIMHEAFDVQTHGFEQAKLKAREARDAAHSNNIAVAENSRPSWKSHSNTGIPHVSLDSQQLRFRAHKFGRRLCRSFSFGRRRGSFASRESAFDAAVLWLIQTPTEEEIAAVSGVSTKLEEPI